MWRKFKNAFFALVESLMIGIRGGLGQRLRYAYYRNRLGSCGTNVRIDEGVIIHNPENVHLGSDIWVMAYSVITAGSEDDREVSGNKKIDSSAENAGRIVIGNEVQIGMFNILNGTGGVIIGDAVTLSARVSIYSATHLDRDKDDTSAMIGANSMVRSRPVRSRWREVHIGEGAWLGLGVAAICASVGAETFVRSGSVISKDLPGNVIAGGQPADVVETRYETR